MNARDCPRLASGHARWLDIAHYDMFHIWAGSADGKDGSRSPQGAVY